MKKILVLGLIIALTLVSLISCGDKKTDGGDNDTGVATVTLKTIENICDYKLVRGDTCSAAEKSEMVKLRTAIKEKLGITMTAATDWVGKGQSESTYEILVGPTNRAQTKTASEGLRYSDYKIAMIDEKIVIAAGSESALTTAVDFFIANFINADAKVLKVPSGDGYHYKGNYKLDKLSVDGVDISEFKLASNGTYKASDFVDKLKQEILGQSIDVVDEMTEGKHYIIIDSTGKIENEYGVYVEDGNLVIKGSYNTVDDALAFFEGDFISGLGSKECNLTAADNKEGTTEKKKIYTKEQLMTVLTQIYNENACIIGQQTEGGQQTVGSAIADFKAASGQNPGIVGIDLACYGLQLPETTEGLWSEAICEITDYCADGGIITASSHFANPSENWGTDAKVRGRLGTVETQEAYNEAFEQVLTEGTEYNKKFKAELELDGRFLSDLKNNGVTVLWRPLHESNGSWFWYCVKQGQFVVDASYLTRMWVYIYDYYTNELGLDNLIWVYAPNVSGNKTNDPSQTLSTSYCYPGDEYVDMVGVDWYTAGNMEIKYANCYLDLTDTRKIGAITEFGPNNNLRGKDTEEQKTLFSCNDLLDALWALEDEGYNFTFLLTWTPGCMSSIGKLGYAEEFMNEDYTLGQADVAARLAKVK